MLSILWRRDGSEGIAWNIRGVRDRGEFYGEIRFQSTDQCKRKGTFVSGQLTPPECERMTELVEIIRRVPPPIDPAPCFAVMFERLSSINAGNVALLFEYRLGDECQSESARSFVELAGLLERHLSLAYSKIT